jgi:phosphate transport system protein
MLQEHIVKSFDQALEGLRRTIMEMGGLAESQIESAIQAVVRRDTGLAGEVMRLDSRLDEYEDAVDAGAVRLLALRQPVAGDLREIVSALKIAADLERVGDYAANIAKRAMTLNQAPPGLRPITGIPRMARRVQANIKEVLDAYTERDVGRALDAWSCDGEVDDLYNSLFRETLTYMLEDPRNITPCTHLLFIAKNLERIGDHATNIAETIYYLVEGRPIRMSRPKGGLTSFEADPQSRGEEIEE